MILRGLLPGQRVRAQLEYLMMNIMKAAFACICLSVTWPFKHSLSSHLSLSQAFRSSEQRKEMLAEKKKKQRGGWGWGESEGMAVRLLNKSWFRYTRFWYTLWLVYFDLLPALRGSLRWMEMWRDALAMRLLIYSSGYLESVVRWFEKSNTVNVEYHPWRTGEIVVRQDLVNGK